MDQAGICAGTLYTVTFHRPANLLEREVQYEATSIRHDWWFKAGVAVVRGVRSAVTAISRAIAPVPQLAQA